MSIFNKIFGKKNKSKKDALEPETIREPEAAENVKKLAAENQEMVERIATMDIAWVKRLMSHNLRMPMTIIKGYADLLENDQDLNDEEVREMLHDICANIDFMNDMMSVVIDDRPDKVIKLDYFDVMSATRRAVKFLEGITTKAGIDVHIIGDREIAMCYGNRLDFTRAIYNLVENSLKYMTRAGSIYITVDQKANETFVIYRDTGVGMSEEEIESLTKRELFDNDDLDKGMGMLLVREMVERAGGTFLIETKENKGFMVYMEFKNNR